MGSTPWGVAFDGTNIWVSNANSNNVMKLSQAGTVLGTFAVGTSPRGLAFDGVNIWVANANSQNVTKLRASDGAKLGTFSLGPGTAPVGIAFDGANIWTANKGTISKL